MRTQLSIITTAVSLLIASGMTVPACLAESEASLQASSFSESNNGSEESRENTSAAQTQNTTGSQRSNDSNSTWQASGPVSTSVSNLHDSQFKSGAGKIWGTAQAWGTPVKPEPKVSQKPETAVIPVAQRAPHMEVTNFHRSSAQLASRPIYSASSHTLIRRGTSSNSRYTYIKKQIRSTEVPM